MVKQICILILFVAITSCKTTTEPIVYDKTIEVIEKDVEIIQLLINDDNYSKAEEYIKNNEEKHEDNLEIKQLKAWLHLKKNDLNKSEKLFMEILEENAKNPVIYAGLARINRIKGNPEKAVEYLDTGLSLLSTLPILWLEKGLLDYEKSDYKKALVNFNKALTLSPKNSEAYFFKYLTFLHLNRELDEVKHYWEKILEDRNFKSYYFIYHADVLYKQNYLDLAKQVIEIGLNYFPNEPYLLNMNAFVLYQTYTTMDSEAEDKKTVLQNAYTNIVKCLDDGDKTEPGFADTYFLILEAQNENELLKEEINKYFFQFPKSKLILKWVKKYLQ